MNAAPPHRTVAMMAWRASPLDGNGTSVTSTRSPRTTNALPYCPSPRRMAAPKWCDAAPQARATNSAWSAPPERAV